MTHQTHMLGWRVEQSSYAAVGRVGDRVGLGFVAANIARAIVGTKWRAEPAAGERGCTGAAPPRGRPRTAPDAGPGADSQQP